MRISIVCIIIFILSSCTRESVVYDDRNVYLLDKGIIITDMSENSVNNMFARTFKNDNYPVSTWEFLGDSGEYLPIDFKFLDHFGKRISIEFPYNVKTNRAEKYTFYYSIKEKWLYIMY